MLWNRHCRPPSTQLELFNQRRFTVGEGRTFEFSYSLQSLGSQGVCGFRKELRKWEEFKLVESDLRIDPLCVFVEKRMGREGGRKREGWEEEVERRGESERDILHKLKSSEITRN